MLDELTGYEEHLRDSEYTGDPRRCPVHPHVKTSSDDGMFDAPCHMCEGEMEEAALAWEYNRENPHRRYCALEQWTIEPGEEPRRVRVVMPPHHRTVSCQDTVNEDDIPF